MTMGNLFLQKVIQIKVHLFIAVKDWENDIWWLIITLIRYAAFQAFVLLLCDDLKWPT